MKLRFACSPSLYFERTGLQREAEEIFRNYSFFFPNEAIENRIARMGIGSIISLKRIRRRTDIGLLIFFADFVAETVKKNADKTVFFETRREVDRAFFGFAKEHGVKMLGMKIRRLFTIMPEKYFPDKEAEPLLDFANDILEHIYTSLER